MASDPAHNVTVLLEKWSGGDQKAIEELMPLVYGELRRLAASQFRRERANHTLQSTAVVHEAFMRLVNQQDVRWQNRAHFYAIAAQMIRRILLDYARSSRAGKRGSGAVKLQLDDALAVPQHRDVDILALNDALEDLAKMDERQSRIVELRYFSGLSIEETAEVMQLSTATVKREWASARAWLFREMSRAGRTAAE
ncbi:MAG TPA: sigma-70 family RNA polymerase sigma factor [Bryobacteraceae bacterium]|jgi:RNA polymerase sigma factor (TIGR02999 family)